MELFDVTVWDTSRDPGDSGGWTMESPPVRVKSTGSLGAAEVVALRGGIKRLEGMRRPQGVETGAYFVEKGSEEGLVFQVEDTNIMKPFWPARQLLE